MIRASLSPPAAVSASAASAAPVSSVPLDPLRDVAVVANAPPSGDVLREDPGAAAGSSGMSALAAKKWETVVKQIADAASAAGTGAYGTILGLVEAVKERRLPIEFLQNQSQRLKSALGPEMALMLTAEIHACAALILLNSDPELEHLLLSLVDLENDRFSYHLYLALGDGINAEVHLQEALDLVEMKIAQFPDRMEMFDAGMEEIFADLGQFYLTRAMTSTDCQKKEAYLNEAVEWCDKSFAICFTQDALMPLLKCVAMGRADAGGIAMKVLREPDSLNPQLLYEILEQAQRGNACFIEELHKPISGCAKLWIRQHNLIYRFLDPSHPLALHQLYEIATEDAEANGHYADQLYNQVRTDFAHYNFKGGYRGLEYLGLLARGRKNIDAETVLQSSAKACLTMGVRNQFFIANVCRRELALAGSSAALHELRSQTGVGDAHARYHLGLYYNRKAILRDVSTEGAEPVVMPVRESEIPERLGGLVQAAQCFKEAMEMDETPIPLPHSRLQKIDVLDDVLRLQEHAYGIKPDWNDEGVQRVIMVAAVALAQSLVRVSLGHTIYKGDKHVLIKLIADKAGGDNQIALEALRLVATNFQEVAPSERVAVSTQLQRFAALMMARVFAQAAPGSIAESGSQNELVSQVQGW